jgi:hypothetical protein
MSFQIESKTWSPIDIQSNQKLRDALGFNPLFRNIQFPNTKNDFVQFQVYSNQIQVWLDQCTHLDSVPQLQTLFTGYRQQFEHPNMYAIAPGLEKLQADYTGHDDESGLYFSLVAGTPSFYLTPDHQVSVQDLLVVPTGRDTKKIPKNGTYQAVSPLWIFSTAGIRGGETYALNKLCEKFVCGMAKILDPINIKITKEYGTTWMSYPISEWFTQFQPTYKHLTIANSQNNPIKQVLDTMNYGNCTGIEITEKDPIGWKSAGDTDIHKFDTNQKIVSKLESYALERALSGMMDVYVLSNQISEQLLGFYQNQRFIPNTENMKNYEYLFKSLLSTWVVSLDTLTNRCIRNPAVELHKSWNRMN